MEDKIVRTACPFCGDVTYVKENMADAFCICCGHRLTPGNKTDTDGKIVKMHRITVGCGIACNSLNVAIDNRWHIILKCGWKSSEIILEEGMHEITAIRFWRAGVISDVDVLKIPMEVDGDGEYVIQVNKKEKKLEAVRKDKIPEK